MKPRHVVITGASGGIGEAIARTLLVRGQEVTLVARAGDRLQAAAQRLRSAAAPARVHVQAADLALQSEVHDLASALATRPIDALVLNAALMPGARRLTAEGVEETLAVNHLAPYLLTRRLLPGLASGARIVVVGADPSMLARAPVDLDDLGFARGFSATRAYMRTKNMNAMFCYALARRLAGSGITVNAGHPGVIRTDLARHARGPLGLLLTLMRPLLPGPDVGADTPAWLADADELQAVHGRFFVKRRAVATAAHTLDPERQERLWQASATLVGLHA